VKRFLFSGFPVSAPVARRSRKPERVNPEEKWVGAEEKMKWGGAEEKKKWGGSEEKPSN
jgi:hypothetical protein